MLLRLELFQHLEPFFCLFFFFNSFRLTNSICYILACHVEALGNNDKRLVAGIVPKTTGYTQAPKGFPYSLAHDGNVIKYEFGPGVTSTHPVLQTHPYFDSIASLFTHVDIFAHVFLSTWVSTPLGIDTRTTPTPWCSENCLPSREEEQGSGRKWSTRERICTRCETTDG